MTCKENNASGSAHATEEKSDNSIAQKIDAIKSIYAICIQTRNFEIEQLIQRNNFFMLFQGVLMAAALQSQTSKPFVEFAICLTGIWVSFYQLQMASGAKFWQEWWESQLNRFEIELKKEKVGNANEGDFKEFYELFNVNFENVYKTVSENLQGRRKDFFTNFLILRAFSVGRAPMKVSIVLLVAWVALFVHTIDPSIFNNFPESIKGFKYVE